MVVMILEIEDATCHPSRPPKAPPFAFVDRPQFTVTRLEDTRSSMDLNMSNLDSRNPQNRSLHFHKFFFGGGGRWGKGGGIEGGGRFEDKRTRVRGAPVPFFWERGEVVAGWGGGCSGNCTPPTCMSPSIVPPASLVSGWTGLFGPLERSCLPPFPPSPPVSPTHADHKRSQNDPKMILVSF